MIYNLVEFEIGFSSELSLILFLPHISYCTSTITVCLKGEKSLMVVSQVEGSYYNVKVGSL